MKKRRSRYRIRGARVLILLLILASAVTAAAFLIGKLFVLERIEVVGNEIYTDEQIENLVFTDDSWNTFLVLCENWVRKEKEIPFVDSMELRLISPTGIRVNVTEKKMLGCVYIPGLRKYAYFDRDGLVVEIAENAIYGVAKITGLDLENAELYEKLGLDAGTLQTLLTLMQLLEEYDIEPESVYMHDGRILLGYGSLRADLGSGTSLDEKIARLDAILPLLEEHIGTLRMNTWSETSADIMFTPGEIYGIPEY